MSRTPGSSSHTFFAPMDVLTEGVTDGHKVVIDEGGQELASRTCHSHKEEALYTVVQEGNAFLCHLGDSGGDTHQVHEAG